MGNLGDRLKKARLEAGLTQEMLSVKSGISQQTIQKIESGKVKRTSYLLSLANSLNISAEWLQFGQGLSTPASFSPKVGVDSAKFKNVPVLNSNQIYEWLANPVLPCEDLNVKIFIANNVGNRSFIYEVTGSAMINPQNTDESLFPGESTLIDPDSNLVSGDIVLAEFGKNDFRYRKYEKDGREEYLKAADSSIPGVRIDQNIKILGVVVASFKYRKKQ